MMPKRLTILRSLLLAASLAVGTGIMGVGGSGRPVQAAPPGWELRNGSWVPMVEPNSTTPDGQVAQMMRDLEAGETKRVIKNAKAWLKVNKTHPLVPQVLLLRGDAEVLRGTRYRALFSYEDLLNNFPSSELYTIVLEREYDCADAFLKGYKRKFLGFHMIPVRTDAIEILDRIQDRQRGSALAERAGLRLADYYYERGDFVEAVDAYSDFLKRYPYSQYVRKAEIRRAEASLGNYHGIRFDNTPLIDARERLTAIEEAYPQTAEQLQTKALADRIFQLEGKKELEIARYYFRAGRYYASAWYYKRVKANWPGTQMAQEAQAELVRRMPDKAGK